jgi:uncharacterized membrane protein YccC
MIFYVPFLATICILFAISIATDSQGSFDSTLFWGVLAGEIVGGAFVVTVQAVSRAFDK